MSQTADTHASFLYLPNISYLILVIQNWTINLGKLIVVIRLSIGKAKWGNVKVMRQHREFNYLQELNKAHKKLFPLKFNLD